MPVHEPAHPALLVSRPEYPGHARPCSACCSVFAGPVCFITLCHSGDLSLSLSLCMLAYVIFIRLHSRDRKVVSSTAENLTVAQGCPRRRCGASGGQRLPSPRQGGPGFTSPWPCERPSQSHFGAAACDSSWRHGRYGGFQRRQGSWQRHQGQGRFFLSSSRGQSQCFVVSL